MLKVDHHNYGGDNVWQNGSMKVLAKKFGKMMYNCRRVLQGQ